MTQDGASKDDVKVPESDLGKEIEAGFEDGKDLLVTCIAAMGEEQVSHLDTAHHILALISGGGHFMQGSAQQGLLVVPENQSGLGVILALRSRRSCSPVLILHLNDSLSLQHSYPLYFSLYNDEGMKTWS